MRWLSMKILGLCVFVLLLVAACAPQEITCPDGTVVRDGAACPEPKPAPAPEPEPEPQPVVEAAPEPEEEFDPAVKALMDKYSSKVQSLQFSLAETRLEPSGVVTIETHTYLVRDDLVKVEVNRGLRWDRETNVDTVYLNYATEVATGFCMSSRSTVCSEAGEERRTEYEEFAVRLPGDWINAIKPNAEIKSTRNFEEREVAVVRYEDDGAYYEFYIDQFSGTPLRVGIYDDAEFKNLVGGAEFRGVVLNTVTEADVMRP